MPQCAACEFVVDRLDRAVRDSLLGGKTVSIVKRGKGKKGKKAKLKEKVEVPWIESELGWGAAVDEVCAYTALADQAFFAKDDMIKLMALESLSGPVKVAAVNMTLGRDPLMFKQFQRACQDILDENERDIIKAVRNPKRTKMKIGTAGRATDYIKGMGGAKDSGALQEDFIPDIGPLTMKAKLCVEVLPNSLTGQHTPVAITAAMLTSCRTVGPQAAKLCSASRFPGAGADGLADKKSEL